MNVSVKANHASVPSLLVADTNPDLLNNLCRFFAELGDVRPASDADEVLRLLEQERYDCLLISRSLLAVPNSRLYAYLEEVDPPLVVMFEHDDPAFTPPGSGLHGLLLKPFSLAQAEAVLKQAIRQQDLKTENKRLHMELAHQDKLKARNKSYQKQIISRPDLFVLAERVDRLQSSEDIYDGITQLLAEYLGITKSAVLMLDHESGNLIAIAQRGLNPKCVGLPMARLGEGVCGKVAAEGQPMLGRPEQQPLHFLMPVTGPYLVLPIAIRGQIFGVMLLAEKRNLTPFKADDIFTTRFLLDKAVLTIENIALYETMTSSMHSTLRSLVSAMEAKDPYTRQHSRRVTYFSELTAQVMGLSLDQTESLRFAAYLHDIGKIGVKDNILLKERTLTAEEYEHIKQHPVIGEAIIDSMDLPVNERAIIRCHHERWDGAGYPDGLKGEEIPLLARIVAVADCFDAMTSDRPYRKGRDSLTAETELAKCAGKQFDPKIVKAFSEMLSRYIPVEDTDHSSD